MARLRRYKATLRWALLVAVGAVLAAVWVWSQVVTAPAGAGSAGESGSYAVSVVGPKGPYYAGVVNVPSPATALASLVSAATAGNFTLDVQHQVMGAYVKRIGPYAETASGGGWNYCIDSGAGFAWVGVAADERPLRRGERVEWRWAEGGSEVC